MPKKIATSKLSGLGSLGKTSLENSGSISSNSKLLLLAKSASSLPRNGTGLESLLKNNGSSKIMAKLSGNNVDNDSSLTLLKNKLQSSSNTKNDASKISKLAALRISRNNTGTAQNVSNIIEGNEENKSLPVKKKMARRRRRKLTATIHRIILDIPLPKLFKCSEDDAKIYNDFNVSNDLIGYSSNASSFFKMDLNNRHESRNTEKAPKGFKTYLYSPFFPITEITNNYELLAKNGAEIKDNFKKPSPDDTVENARSNTSLAQPESLTVSVTGITKSLSNMHVKPKPTKPTVDIDMQKIIDRSSLKKPTLSFAVIGHVDAGKSTLMGMFLKLLNKVDKNFIRKLEEESSKAGKKSFALAWIMDQTSEERSRGVTVDICTTTVDTPRANFVIIDAPGHRDYVPRMIAGLSQADISLLIIDANDDGFESGFSYNGQTKEHALLAYSLGIKTMIVALNKLDMVSYDQGRFFDIKERLSKFLVEEIGFEEKNLFFVPVSGIDGTNIVKKPTNDKLTSWYPNTQATLLEVLETVANSLGLQNVQNNQNILKENFLFQISDVNTDFRLTGEFAIVGRVNSGVIKQGETIATLPGNVFVQIDSIKTSESTAGKAVESFNDKGYAMKYDNNIYLMIKNKTMKEELLENYNLLRAGDIACGLDCAIKTCTKFICDIQLFDLRGKPLLLGANIMLHSLGEERPSEIHKIIEAVTEGKKKKKKNILHLSSNSRAVVQIHITDVTGDPRPLPLSTFDENSKMGTVVFRKGGFTIGSGKVREVL